MGLSRRMFTKEFKRAAVQRLERGSSIRVASADELKERIELYLKEVNDTPVVFRWKYKIETLFWF